jgi:AhpD family alkylhydroperoxidase
MTSETRQIPVRLDFDTVAAGFARAMAHLDQAATKELDKAQIDPKLRELIRIRASQLNGCAYCIDMHTKDARAIGETEQRIYGLAAWRETPYFTPRERAALAFTETVTRLSDTHVPDQAYQDVAAEFGPQEVAALVSLIVTINAWNAISVATRAWVPGSYQPLCGEGGGVGAPGGVLGAAGEADATADPEQGGPGVRSGQVGGGLREDTGQHAAAQVAGRVEAEAEALGDVVAVQQGLVAAQPGETLRVGHPVRMVGADVRAGRAHHRGEYPPAGDGELEHFGGRGVLLGGGDGPDVTAGGLDRELPGVGEQAVPDVLGGMPAIPLQAARPYRPVTVGQGQQAAHDARDHGVEVTGGYGHDA